jgi:DNA-binding response OmpR family regulator
VDNGIGISKDSIAHLFERYYKITESHLGSGIGLAFVKSLTTLHKGHIFVYSERDQGTEIIIGIPVGKEDYDIKERWIYNNKEAGARLESIQSKEEHELSDENLLPPEEGDIDGDIDGHGDDHSRDAGDDSRDGGRNGDRNSGRLRNKGGLRNNDELRDRNELGEGDPLQEEDSLHWPLQRDQWTGRPRETDQRPHILVVDDNEELRNFLKESLSPKYHITEAKDGQTGLSVAKEKFPDIIISDVMMPGMDGIEFCRQIKENIETSHIPFLMLTARDALESRLEGVESGADFYFAKPLSIQLLNLTIRNILTQKQNLKKRYFSDHYSEAKELVHSRKDKEFMDQLTAIIGSHLTNPDMDVDYICTQMGMSRTKLYQKIKNVTGQSIGEFVRKIRLRKAVQLMTHQDVSLMDVMYSVGIQTQSYFTKAFKKEFGKTPSQFLKDLHK